MTWEKDSYFRSTSIPMESLLVTLSLVLQGRTVNLVMRDAAEASAEYERIKKVVKHIPFGKSMESGRISRSHHL